MTSIIILTCNRLEYTKKCVKSIRRHTRESHEIIFVDNASTDSTVKWLQNQVKENKNYFLIQNKENIGVAGGRNQGINLSHGEFILLLDNDVVVGEGWLSAMLECINLAPDAGIIGPMTNNSHGIQRSSDESCQLFERLDVYASKLLTQYPHQRIPRRNISGFCMLFKRTLLEKIGLFDDRFGDSLYEDDDFCLRAALEGYRNYIAGNVFVYHFSGKRSQGNKIIFEDKWTLNTESPEGRKIVILQARELANDFYYRENIDQSVRALINCIKVTPDEPIIYHELARILIEAKEYSQAWDTIEAMPDMIKNDLKSLELIGYIKEGLGMDNEAADYADKILSQHENHAAALNLQGILAYKKEDKNKARNFIQKAIDSDPGYGEAYTNLGIVLWSMGEKDKALSYLKNGFLLSPNIPDVRSLYYSVISSGCLFSDAESDFHKSSMLYPNSRSLAFLYIDLLIQQGKFAIAMNRIEDALDIFGLDEGLIKAALSIREKIGPLEIKKSTFKGTLSLCIILKNEEKYLVKCFKSIRDVVDEIIVVDTGSTDKTKDIARVFGAKVYDFTWTGDFSAARNHSLQQAQGEWILILDADEVISKRDFDELKAILRKRALMPEAYSIVTRNYLNTYSTAIDWTKNTGQYSEEAGTGWIASAKVRLFPRGKNIFFTGPVHELLEISLSNNNIPILPCSIVIHHYGKLDMARESQKSGDYYQLGKMKYESDPENVFFINELAKQSLVLDKGEEAVELWLKLLSILKSRPQTEGFSEAEIYSQLASSYMILNRYEEALEVAYKAMEINTAGAKEVINVYAHCEIIAGSLDKAHSVLEELLTTEPDYPPALFLMAVTCCLKGIKEKAQKLIRLLLQRRILITPLLNKVVKQLHAYGKCKEAMLILAQAIESGTIDDETMKLISA